MLKKITIVGVVIIVLILSSIVGLKFFMFSDNELKRNEIVLSESNNYSIKILKDLGFNKTDGSEQYFTLSKVGHFNLKFEQNQIKVENVKLSLHSSYDIKPLFWNYSLEVDSIIDGQIIKVFEFHFDTTYTLTLPPFADKNNVYFKEEIQISELNSSSNFIVTRNIYFKDHKFQKIVYEFRPDKWPYEEGFFKQIKFKIMSMFFN